MNETSEKRVMDSEGIRRAIARIAFEILEKNKGAGGLVIFGIGRRGMSIARRIGKKILEIEHIAPPVLSLDVKAYRTGACAGGQSEAGILEDESAVDGKTAVIVDDVLFTGRTAFGAIEGILKSGAPRGVQLAILVDRGHRELPIRPDYVGKNLPTSRSEMVHVRMREFDAGPEEVVIASGKNDFGR